MAIHISGPVHAMGKLPACRVIGKDNVTAQREKRIIESIAVARRARDMKFEHGILSLHPEYINCVQMPDCGPLKN
jgi:hypothetical protein